MTLLDRLFRKKQEQPKPRIVVKSFSRETVKTDTKRIETTRQLAREMRRPSPL